MSLQTFVPFICWSAYKSCDPHRPDVLELRVVDLKPYTESISINAKVDHKDSDGKWHEKRLPIKYHDSKNFSLLKQWHDALKKGKLRKGSKIRIKTWLGKSKWNSDRTIRRFKLVF